MVVSVSVRVYDPSLPPHSRMEANVVTCRVYSPGSMVAPIASSVRPSTPPLVIAESLRSRVHSLFQNNATTAGKSALRLAETEVVEASTVNLNLSMSLLADPSSSLK